MRQRAAQQPVQRPVRHLASLLLAALLLGGGGCGGSGGGGTPSSNADLTALTLSAGTLSPAFDQATLPYAAATGFWAVSVQLTPTAADAGATITVDGTPTASGAASAAVPLGVGVTPITVQVTAADAVTVRSYVVAFTRAAVAAHDAYVKASNAEAGDLFGSAVALSGDTLVVGAPGEDSNATGVGGNQADNSAVEAAGAAYVFVRTGTAWAQQAYLKASNNDVGDQFGFSVAISGDTIVVGADSEDSNATGVGGNQADNSALFSGAAYVFVRTGTTWAQQAYLKGSNTEALDTFGDSVAISGDTIVVGARAEDSNATGVGGNQADNSTGSSGAAYVFVRTGTAWAQQAYLKASNTEGNDFFSSSIAISGDTIVVGARAEDSNATGVGGNQADNSAFGSGAAYVFVRTGTAWAQQAYIKASNTGAGDRFGESVAISGDTIVVGAYLEDSNATGVGGNQANNSATDAGAAYVLR